jgi:hypothetical protein
MSLVFSLDVFFKSLHFRHVGVVMPSISVAIAENDPVVLWRHDVKVKDGDVLEIRRGDQVMVTTDVFAAADQWHVRFDLTMPADQVTLGTATFEFRSLIVSALANCGPSAPVTLQVMFRDHRRTEIALLTFDARVNYYAGSEHQAQAEIIVSRQLQPTQEPPRNEHYDPRFGDLVESSAHYSGGSEAAELVGSHASVADARRENQQQLERASRSSSSGKGRDAAFIGRGTEDVDRAIRREENDSKCIRFKVHVRRRVMRRKCRSSIWKVPLCNDLRRF